MREFTSIEQIRSAVGEELGASDWLEVTQERVDAFADATNDHQWIHVDVDRAAAGPFGGTIAHGFLTLSLLPYFSTQVFSVHTAGPRLNYGLNKVRFPAPVPVGARLRGRATLADLVEVPAGHQMTVRYVVEIEGSDKPACVAEMLALLVSAG